MKLDFYKEAEASEAELISLIEALCAIPAPLHEERGRANFVMNWLSENQLSGAYIDNFGNVVLPYRCCDKKYIAFTAHMDTVFPEKAVIPVAHEGTIAECPGIGDDTTNMAAELLLARWVIQNKIQLSYPLLFVWDTGEEGLGDLKGARGLMEEYDGQIEAMVALDAVYSTMINRAVGSVRYRITIETEGGHSFRNFGSPNAIERAAALVERLYQQSLPKIPDSHTTFNVGMISGGTSVNTIAQNATFLYEFRSDTTETLQYMEAQLKKILENAKKDCKDLTVELIGRRPAGGDRAAKQAALEKRWIDAAKAVLPEMNVKILPGSTDCNMPLSQGIPAICVGIYRGGAAHTYEEWVDYRSLKTGYEILLRFVNSFERN